MASQFTFSPMGLSRAVTVGGAAPATISLALQTVGQAGTVSVAAGNYLPGSIRVVNDGTAAVFLQLAESAAKISVSTTIGFEMLPASVETFGLQGRPFLAATCGGTGTVTLSVVLGEGM